ncbi:MAG: hypothetical protein ABL893_16040 [Hyphomicrobium sp.]
MIDDAEMRRRKNGLRFKWYELVLADPAVRRRPNAPVVANHVKTRFDIENGYAEFSLNHVVRKYGVPRSTVLRNRDFLLKRGWIQVVERPKGPAGRHMALRYSLAFGPDDLLPDEHVPSSIDDT